MSPAFEKDWTNLTEGVRVDIYVKGADEPNEENVKVTEVVGGEYIRIFYEAGGHQSDFLSRDTYEVVRL